MSSDAAPVDPTAGPEPGDRHGWSEHLRAVATELREAPSYARATALYRQASGAPEELDGFSTVRIGVLRNVTVEPWLPELFVALLQRGVRASFWLGDLGVFEAYATNAKAIDQGVDYVLVHLDARTLAGDARHEPPSDLEEAILRRVEGVLAGLLEHTRAGIIVSNLGPAPAEQHAPHSDQDPAGWLTRRRAINLELVRRLANDPRVSILDVDRLLSEFGARRAYDTRMYLTARSPFRLDFLPELGRALAEVVAADHLPPKKCVVVDCDNTLWGGVLGEDGPDGVAIGVSYPGSAYREFQFFLKGLAARGILLAINSKNQESDVFDFFAQSAEMVLRADDFVAHRINWRDKASNLLELAEEMNIGPDSIIFIDDSDVECALVRSRLPDVQVERFPSNPAEIEDFCSSVANLGRLVVTDDDVKRSASLKANKQRERLRREAPDLSDFVRSLEIELVIRAGDRESVQRISQLTQRTNQFNLTTHRYSVDEVERWFGAGSVYTMRMKDRFSDYGMVGVAMTRPLSPDVHEIDTFLLSCRAFGRGVEVELLRAVLSAACARGATTMRASHIPSAKNAMTRDFFVEHGFVIVEDTEVLRRFERRLGSDDAEGKGAPGPYTVERIGFDD